MQKNKILKAILKLKERANKGLINLPKTVKIVEVGPRDGLQNEKKILTEDFKIQMINNLYKSGLYHIECGSFVSPKWVPQMANSEKVIQKIQIPEKLKKKAIISALTPNIKGFENAIKTQINEIAVFTAASETFTKKNINATISESLTKFKPIIKRAKLKNIKVRGYISCVMGCPYEGHVDPMKVVRLAVQLLAMGCSEVSLGDTVGVGDVEKTRLLMQGFRRVNEAVRNGGGVNEFGFINGFRKNRVGNDFGKNRVDNELGKNGVFNDFGKKRVDNELGKNGVINDFGKNGVDMDFDFIDDRENFDIFSKLAAHFHDTYGNAILNLLIVLENGINVIDSSVGGIGGCPYAKKSVGNVCTENVVEMLNLLGIESGVDLEILKKIGKEYGDFLEKDIEYLI